ncbi:superoxide dismutase family protein [Sporolactobacillus terrae]|uniref:Superoxide dismutase n=1 Tax=Sporolactobacillus terrae TaxID=269673 RepID=A0A410D7M4_9BACL|nr:superoxide dismutase family protein [Sporolactobacillus terrae]QAA22129.1 superoxide dismutase [Sporolactobacillus terrae]QAA25101.1 superoxide dismutase [Sporolactobacillus terrae]UAK16921.1 superoxide dismutase family protein [Sporolactobacillus terrae]BBN98429.1 superoxide dismutase [Cu-Zn] 1 [Sporolactobacillus terrae]
MKYQKLIYALCAMLALIVIAFVHHPHLSANAKDAQNGKLIVSLINAKNEEMGTAKLSETAKGVRIELEAEGLTPGIHAIHFHEYGSCTPPDFMSAGAHFNPENKKHGLKNPMGPHAGDMVNIFADRHGHVKTVLFNSMVTLKEGKPNSLRDADGSALIIHEKGDDQVTDPSGNSGDRILCGVIK